MYRGVKLDDLDVRDYTSAVAALEQRAKRSRKYKDEACPGGAFIPLGHPRSETTSVRMERDESVVFRLYATDVITWNKDDSVDVCSYPTQTTSAFARALLPRGMYLGTDQMMTIHPPIEKRQSGAYDWATWNRKTRICNADATYRKVGSRWEPDPDTLTPMTFYELDRKASREISREHNLADFKRWLFMASVHMEIEHRKVDYGFCAEMLKARDFRSAAMHLPTLELTHSFGLAERMKPLRFAGLRWDDQAVTMTSIEYVRWWLYGAEGALSRIRVPIVSRAEYTSRVARTRQLERAEVYV
jgi:hypothetical protein